MVNQIMNFGDMVMAAIVAVLSTILGQHWFLFALFLFMNILDCLTGWMKSKVLKTTVPTGGIKCIMKKIGYWAMVLFAFALSCGLMEIGKILGIDLSITTGLGWFVLSSLIINEARSVINNYVTAGFRVPTILVQIVDLVNNLIIKKSSIEDE